MQRSETREHRSPSAWESIAVGPTQPHEPASPRARRVRSGCWPGGICCVLPPGVNERGIGALDEHSEGVAARFGDDDRDRHRELGFAEGLGDDEFAQLLSRLIASRPSASVRHGRESSLAVAGPVQACRVAMSAA